MEKIKKHNLNHIIIICLLMIIIGMIFYINNRSKYSKNQIERISNTQKYTTLLESYEKWRIINDGQNVWDCIITDLNNNTTTLSNIVTKAKLIIRFSSMGCDNCIQQEIEIIENLGVNIDDNIIILVSNQNIRALNLFNKIHNCKIKVYKSDPLNIPFEETNRLYMFILDSSYTVKNFFIPEETLPKLSITYYETIYEKYFKKNSSQKVTSELSL